MAIFGTGETARDEDPLSRHVLGVYELDVSSLEQATARTLETADPRLAMKRQDASKSSTLEHAPRGQGGC